MNSTHKPFVGPAVKVAVSMSMLVITSDLFAQAEVRDGYTMLLYPKQDKNERITLLAETHRIKGGSQTVNTQPPQPYPYLSIYEDDAGNGNLSNPRGVATEHGGISRQPGHERQLDEIV